MVPKIPLGTSRTPERHQPYISAGAAGSQSALYVEPVGDGHTRPSSHSFFSVRPISVHFPSIMESAPATRAAGPLVPLLLVGVAWPEAGLEPGLEPATLETGGERLSLADACLQKGHP